MVKSGRKYYINTTLSKAALEDSKGAGEISGYASTFGNLDRHKDIINKGAFSKSIREINRKGGIPILYNHKDQIGWNEKIREDERGLFVKGEILKDNDAIPKAREAWAFIQSAMEKGIDMGLSIGGIPTDYEAKFNKDGRFTHYEINGFDLLEYSVTPIPANQQAQITSMKAFLGEEESKEASMDKLYEEIKSLKEQAKELETLKALVAEKEELIAKLATNYKEIKNKNQVLLTVIKALKGGK